LESIPSGGRAAPFCKAPQEIAVPEKSETMRRCKSATDKWQMKKKIHIHHLQMQHDHSTELDNKFREEIELDRR